MGDRLTTEDRSAHMRLIRGRNTQPEIRVRKLLHALGYRFRLHSRNLPGSPDVVLPRHRTALFVHGCFWHQHTGCSLARKPKSRPEYWLPKLERNSMRDREANARLHDLGWRSVTVWECETTDEDALRARLLELLS
ncbi:very short patch repair endonuclease [Rhizobiaceae sp. 2RAB30]